VAEHAARVEGGPGAGHESDQHPERHRHVHADAALTHRPPCAAEERRCGKQQHRQRQQPTRPMQQALQVGRDIARLGQVDRRREHHHLHGTERRDEPAPQRQALLALAQCAGVGRQVGRGVVAGRANGAQQGR
jgi:hypothetical protein